MTTTSTISPPEYNVTGQDYAERAHFRYAGSSLLDIHAHITRTRPTDPPTGPSAGSSGDASIASAETFMEVAEEFGVHHVVSMCPPEDIPILRERFGKRMTYSGSITKKLEEPEDEAYRLLDRFLEQGVKLLKFWSAPRGQDRGLFVDAPWRIEAARRARAAGVRLIMVHVADPDIWFRTVYADAQKFSAKADQYLGLERMLKLFPDITWIGAHMGGDPEHADHLEDLLESHPNLHFDTSATKWQVREVSAHREAIRSLMCRYPDRFLFGSDIVTRHGLDREHYVSRYWCQRTLWESAWVGPSPIADPDFQKEVPDAGTPELRGLQLPFEVLDHVYRANAQQLLGAEKPVES